MTKTILKLNGYGGVLKTIIEVIVIVIFAWTFIQVRDIPATYATKLEMAQVKTETKTDIERIIEPMRVQITQIYTHLLKKDK